MFQSGEELRSSSDHVTAKHVGISFFLSFLQAIFLSLFHSFFLSYNLYFCLYFIRSFFLTVFIYVSIFFFLSYGPFSCLLGHSHIAGASVVKGLLKVLGQPSLSSAVRQRRRHNVS